MYNWHKYWARKTWNVVGQYINHYCPSNGIVLDPFSGSGVTAIEALRSGRRVIAIDNMPIANNILRATVIPADLLNLHEEFDTIKQNVMNEILEFYRTKCRKCVK